MSIGPQIKRLVDLVDRGPEDDIFFPTSAADTVFRRMWPTYHNVVPDIVEVGYQGSAAWGGRITVNLRHKETGDLVNWICLRLKPCSWLGPDLEAKLLSGQWSYSDPNVKEGDPGYAAQQTRNARAWMWAASLGSAAIQKVEFEINDTTVETWSGEWMDIWSRAWMDGGRGAVWDSDIYGQMPSWEMHDTSRPPWTTVLPTSDGYVYCWLPLAFFRRPQSAFPLVALSEQQEVRLHITLRPFRDVVRRRAVPRSDPCEVPLGSELIVYDNTGPTSIPRLYRLPTAVPGFDEVNVLAGVVHTEDPLRSAYMRVPIEMMYERVTHMRFDVPDGLCQPGECRTVALQLPLTELNGPIKEIAFFLRRKAVWGFNEWTNYGALLEPALVATKQNPPTNDDGSFTTVTRQLPLLVSATLMVGNAPWLTDNEEWWRLEYGLAHRGGVRLAAGMVYGFVFGDGAGWTPEDLQPAGTVNASRADMRLDIQVAVPPVAPWDQTGESSKWEVHVFGIGVNWMRFVEGLAQPLFQD
jgi:hypothetical protein